MRKLLFCCIAIILTISSCSKEEMDDSLSIKNGETSLRPFDLSEQEALSIAEHFQKSINSSQKTRGKVVTCIIKDKYLLNSGPINTRVSCDSITPLIYEIEINDGDKMGRMIISGDKRAPEVLTYIPSFNDSLFKVSSEPMFMTQMAKSTLLTKIKNCKSESITRSHNDTIHGEINALVMPLCTTEWGETYPYNKLYPYGWVEYIPKNGNLLGSSYETNYPTGKPILAMAQIMAFLEPSLTLNKIKMDWAALKADTEVTEPNVLMVATLFKFLNDITDSQPVWVKSKDGRWPVANIIDAVSTIETPIENLRNAFNTKLGISCAAYQSWNLETIKKSIIDIQPVYVGDSKNAFIIDGYAVSETSTQDYYYLHCNFCRSGYFDGYYLIDNNSVVFDLNGEFYRDFTLKIIPYIKNKLP